MLAWTLLTLALAQIPAAAPLRSLEKGAMSQISSARQVAVTDRDAWARLWREHAPDRPLPNVDFTREMVAAVFMGERPRGGYAIEIVGYREQGGSVVVQYRETAPARDAITAQVIVSPYHLVALPRRAGTVTFEKLG
jgi:protease stability complex PrcB-like protein